MDSHDVTTLDQPSVRQLLRTVVRLNQYTVDEVLALRREVVRLRDEVARLAAVDAGARRGGDV
jgi:hypothetical protein